MDRTEQRYVMTFLFMDEKKYKAIHTELSRVLKGYAVWVDVCKYWCRKFKAGDFSMDDRLRPGRPPIKLSGAIMSLLSDEPFLSTRVLAVRLSSTHQTIKRVLVSDLGTRKFGRRWIPHDLSEANRREGALKANLLLEELRADEGNEFANTMTGDESWFFLSYESDSMFASTRDEVIPRTSQKFGSEKIMVTIFSGTQLMCLDYLPRGQKFNKLYFKDVILHQIGRALNRGRGQSRTKSMRIHMDNARVQAAGDCIAEIQRLKMTRFSQPAYRPDLSPCDF
jgi:hypothetical protein